MVMASWHGIDKHSTTIKMLIWDSSFLNLHFQNLVYIPFPSFETWGGLKFHIIMEDIFQYNEIRYVYYYIVYCDSNCFLSG